MAPGTASRASWVAAAAGTSHCRRRRSRSPADAPTGPHASPPGAASAGSGCGAPSRGCCARTAVLRSWATNCVGHRSEWVGCQHRGMQSPLELDPVLQSESLCVCVSHRPRRRSARPPARRPEARWRPGTGRWRPQRPYGGGGEEGEGPQNRPPHLRGTAGRIRCARPRGARDLTGTPQSAPRESRQGMNSGEQDV